MNTILYIMRHADKKDKVGEDFRSIDDLAKNKTVILTVKGEEHARQLSEHPELIDICSVWSSDYVRTIQTAKYIAHKNGNQLVNIHPSLGERIKGSTPSGKHQFAHEQWTNEDYQTIDGESRKTVNFRMTEAINFLLRKYKGKKFAVVSHTTSINFYFLNWCTVNTETKNMHYQNKLISTNFKIPKAGLYKLTFDKELNLLDLEPLTEIHDKIDIR